jgi:hypothetical protein
MKINLYLSLFLLSLPLVSIIMLLAATSEMHRRRMLRAVLGSLCLCGFWYLLVTWVVFKAEEFKAANPEFEWDVSHLFEGKGSALITNFVNEPRLFAAYVVCIGLTTYFANRRAIQRIKPERL